MIVCKECKYYIKPTLGEKIFMPDSPFNGSCAHEKARDEVTGKTVPCYTVRVLTCQGGRLYEAKHKN